MADPNLDADWSALSPEKKAELTALIQKLDGAKLYQGAARLGIGNAKAYEMVAMTGGLPQNELTALARFRMHSELTGGDPNWQGPTQIPSGMPAAKDSPENVDTRRSALLKANKGERAKMVEDGKRATYQSKERHYDSLAAPKSRYLVEEQASLEEPDEKLLGKTLLQLFMNTSQLNRK